MSESQSASSIRKTRSAGDIPRSPSLHRSSASSPNSAKNPLSTTASPRILEVEDPSQDVGQPPENSHQARSTTIPEVEPPTPITALAPASPTVLPIPTLAGAMPPLPPPRQHNRSVYSRTMAFFGVGRQASRERRIIVSVTWNLGWGLVQFVVIATFLVIAAKARSPRFPDLNEWQACERPLGIWCCLWIVRVALASSLSYWGYRRDRAAVSRSDAESGLNVAGTPAIPMTPRSPVATPTSAGRLNPGITTNGSAPTVPVSPGYRRLSLLSSFLSLAWFLTAHILEYTSVETCRHTAPHLWWTVFGILAITYLLILEVILLGFVVFILAPVLFLIWNILLMCIGRHPLQNPHMISPEIGKLSKTDVNRIPLVMYIPPPPDSSISVPIKVPEAVYSYPPKSPAVSSVEPRRRFRFLPRKRRPKAPTEDKVAGAAKNGDLEKKAGGEIKTWEDHWEPEGYPFVVLEGNRASCAICLMDFEEPKRVDGVAGNATEASGSHVAAEITPAHDDTSSVHVPGSFPITEESRTAGTDGEGMQLEDAGEGAQPLRLLTCGHVFHKTCLDPWLIDVSGRCPVCQRPVDIPQSPQKKKGPRWPFQSRNPRDS